MRYITYRKGTGGLRCLTDAAWGQGVLDRMSISGNVFLLNGGAVSWVSKKQPCVALSSLEGEYMSLSLGVRHVVWMRQFFLDVGVPLGEVCVETDSLSAVALSKDHQFHPCTKHIDICHHYLWDVIERGWISVKHVAGVDNLVDMFTKALPGPLFKALSSVVFGL